MIRRFGCYCLTAVGLLITVLFLFADLKTYAQDTEPKLLSEAEFVLSEKAVAAGIDGLIHTSISIDKTGRVKSVTLYGGPAWPCDSSRPSEIESVRDDVKKHIQTLVFSPATKNGKPRDLDVWLDFAVGEAYKRAVAVEDARKAIAAGNPTVVKGGVLNGKAVYLPKPVFGIRRGLMTIQVLIDEKGNVVKAGPIAGDLLLLESSREAACDSKFSPPTLGGKPIRVTGTITYNYVR